MRGSGSREGMGSRKLFGVLVSRQLDGPAPESSVIHDLTEIARRTMASTGLERTVVAVPLKTGSRVDGRLASGQATARPQNCRRSVLGRRGGAPRWQSSCQLAMSVPGHSILVSPQGVSRVPSLQCCHALPIEPIILGRFFPARSFCYVHMVNCLPASIDCNVNRKTACWEVKFEMLISKITCRQLDFVGVCEINHYRQGMKSGSI